MVSNTNFTHSSVLVVGAGPAGLAAAITFKCKQPDADVVVLDKAASPGEHNLSGAVMDPAPLEKLLNLAQPDWRANDTAKALLSHRVTKDQVLMFLGKGLKVTMMPAIKAARLLHMGFGQMVHKNDVIISISQLTAWLAEIATTVGVEVLYGFAAEDILCDDTGKATGVKLKDQGLDHQGNKQRNYLAGETLTADIIMLAEGCDGLVSESFIRKANLRRACPPLYSVGVKEIIQVSPQQYAAFGDGRVVHAMGYPLWTPILGPGMFGGGIMYPMGENRIAVGVIVGADWKYRDFIPQDALVRFKEHRFVRRFIDGGTVVEAGAKMIPEGGYWSLPRDPDTGAVGRHNVLLLGDSAGYVNMLKIKGLHNAIASGLAAGQAAAETLGSSFDAASLYTRYLDTEGVMKEMRSARNFRQTVAKFGNSVGMPLSTLGGLLPRFKVEPDYEAMTNRTYKWRLHKPFDKDAFTAAGRVEHREEQPCHCEVLDPDVCEEKCPSAFDRPCIKFCPAGVYELIHGVMKPANPSNCLHCKTCENKCPYDNLRWHVPEGTGGPHYRTM
ncbi:MAG: 4Fe-4S dicluster domain-containing protein [Sedimentisphaerales bacterium]|nr:4Fe-4S dicluster domain-containing protein [Sedimentisphaerales bacterium]